MEKPEKKNLINNQRISSLYEVGFILPQQCDLEAKISKIQCKQFSNVRYVLYIILSLSSLGSFWLYLYWNENIKTDFLYNNCLQNDATHYLIYCEDKTETLVQQYVKITKINNVQRQFYSYYYCATKQKFVIMEFNIEGHRVSNILDKYGQGISNSLEYQNLLQNFGPNQIQIPQRSIIQLMQDEVLDPLYLFLIFSVILWFFQQYFYYSGCVLFVSLLTIIANTIRTQSSLRKMQEVSYITPNVRVLRYLPQHLDYSSSLQDLKEYIHQIHSSGLVPGDLVLLEEQQIIASDMILVQGTCIINESALTGESIPVIKNCLISDDSLFDSQETHRSNYLNQGTYCMEVKNNCEQVVLGIVVKTGFSTNKGQLIRQILFIKNGSNLIQKYE